jgi:hypothetical protein
MTKPTSIGSFAWRGVKRLALVVAAGVLPATAQVATVTTVSSLSPYPAAQIVRFTAPLQFAPAAGAYRTATITFRYADIGNVLGTRKCANVRLNHRTYNPGVHGGVHAVGGLLRRPGFLFRG